MKKGCFHIKFLKFKIILSNQRQQHSDQALLNNRWKHFIQIHSISLSAAFCNKFCLVTSLYSLQFEFFLENPLTVLQFEFFLENHLQSTIFLPIGGVTNSQVFFLCKDFISSISMLIHFSFLSWLHSFIKYCRFLKKTSILAKYNVYATKFGSTYLYENLICLFKRSLEIEYCSSFCPLSPSSIGLYWFEKTCNCLWVLISTVPDVSSIFVGFVLEFSSFGFTILISSNMISLLKCWIQIFAYFFPNSDPLNVAQCLLS